MKILVTGGSGLLGKALQNIDTNYELIFSNSKKCDLTNFILTYRYIEKINPDIIIHCAACVGGLFKNIECNIEMLERNLLINHNVLHIAHKLNINRVISCLSTCVFPNEITYPIDETMIHCGPPHDSNEGYSYAKRILEIQSRLYSNQYKRKYTCVIPTNLYGPDDNFNIQNGHVIPSLIHKCYIAKNENKKFKIKGSGKPLRQFIYSDDIAKIIMRIIDENVDHQNIIISVDEEDEMSIFEIAIIIAECFDYKGNIELEDGSDGQYKKTASNRLLRNSINNLKFTPIKEGIIRTVDWFVNNYNSCRK